MPSPRGRSPPRAASRTAEVWSPSLHSARKLQCWARGFWPAANRAPTRTTSRWQMVVEANEEDTVRTILFGHGWPNAPHRTLQTAFVNQWLGQEGRGQESRPDEPVVGQTVISGQSRPVLRFMGFPPNSDASGDIDSMDLLAGQCVG